MIFRKNYVAMLDFNKSCVRLIKLTKKDKEEYKKIGTLHKFCEEYLSKEYDFDYMKCVVMDGYNIKIEEIDDDKPSL